MNSNNISMEQHHSRKEVPLYLQALGEMQILGQGLSQHTQVTAIFTDANGLLMTMGKNQRSMRSLLVRLANASVRVFVNGQ
ncbi:hypothetical protein CIP107521_00322 [Corynebacterium diphtheriae]|nr:hypothetical protein CIP107521_00322 [Corynebacterium diphtheriae]